MLPAKCFQSVRIADESEPSTALTPLAANYFIERVSLFHPPVTHQVVLSIKSEQNSHIMCCSTSFEKSTRPRRLIVPDEIALPSSRIELMSTKNTMHSRRGKFANNISNPTAPMMTHLATDRTKSYAEIFFDALPMLVSITAGIYKTNASILNECFTHIMYDYCPTKAMAPASSSASCSNLICLIIQVVYLIDILRNFLCTNDNNANVINSKRRKVLKYILTWFIIDAINIIPWEAMIVQPLYNYHSRRHAIFKIIGFLRVCPEITKRWQYIVKARRIARSLGYHRHLRYVRHMPKYILFFTRMKMILIVRGLQHVRWTNRLLGGIRKRTS